MNKTFDTQQRLLKASHIAPIVVYAGGWISLHAAWFIIPVAIWCLYAMVSERSQAIKHSYQELLKTIGICVGFNLCAFAVFRLGLEYDQGNLFNGGAEDFGYMLMHFAAAGVLALVGAVWPLVRLVKGLQTVA